MSKPEPRNQDIALVLGAGGARGLAHIGAIEVLEKRGYRIRGIAGSSMGALVGGIHAAGKLADYRDWVCTLQRTDVLRLLDFVFGHPGLIKGDRVIGVLREMVGKHEIESLPIPFIAVATDLEAQREIWLTRGPLFDAIRGSIAIPMIFTPHRVMGRELVDGGLLSPLPIAATRLLHADRVVAVDINARDARPLAPPELDQGRAIEVQDMEDSEEEEPSGFRARIAALMEGFADRRAATRREAAAQPGLMDLMSRALDTMQGQMARMQLALDPPDLLIRIPRDACLFYEYWRAKELIEIGREAAEAALDA